MPGRVSSRLTRIRCLSASVGCIDPVGMLYGLNHERLNHEHETNRHDDGRHQL